LAISLSCGLDDRATLCRLLGNLLSWLLYRIEFSSGRWPASDVGGYNCGCRVDGPLSLPHNRLGLSLSGATPNSRSQGSRSSRPNTRLAGVKPVVS
jgi:hypothetical protein